MAIRTPRNAAGQPDTQETTPQNPSRTDSIALRSGWTWLFLLLLAAVPVWIVYALLQIWPQGEDGPNTVSLWFFCCFDFELTREQQYLLIAALAGALGSIVHLATSFTDFLGNQQLKTQWLPWYALRPFTGMALALIMYFILRAGLVGGMPGTAAVNPYGVAALSGLTGMFSKQAIDKLREIFENLFRTQKEIARKDPLKKDDDTPEKGGKPVTRG